MAAAVPVSHRQQVCIAALACLLFASLALSGWTTAHSLVKLPAADVWQHISLIEQASAGQIRGATLLQKHNQLHFIPLPKLVYALDFLLFSGSGLLTAAISACFTLLCCALFARAIFALAALSLAEKSLLSLLCSSWLACILQWESLANPANLQWSGMNAGLALLALTLQKNPLPKKMLPGCVAGAALAIGCGTPWWLLAAAVAAIRLPARILWRGVLLLLACVATWELANTLWWQQFPPLPLLVITLATPIPAEQMENLRQVFSSDPGGFYTQWLSGLATFFSSFCLPPLARWLTPALLATLSPLPLLALAIPAARPAAKDASLRAFTFMATVALLTALAAGLARSHLPGAYTLRFANTGLLFVSAVFVRAYLGCHPRKRPVILWWLAALGYSSLLAISCIREAANIVHDSNQRRLSQVAYSLDIRDMRATSEMPYAPLPLMELSYREINERKAVLQSHAFGIYHSHEYRVFSGNAPLPAAETGCQYRDITTKPLKDDASARKLSGLASSVDGDTMDSILLRDSNGQAIGYGIAQYAGNTLAEQLDARPHWAGFLHLPAGGAVQVIAYNRHQRCQPLTLALP